MSDRYDSWIKGMDYRDRCENGNTIVTDCSHGKKSILKYDDYIKKKNSKTDSKQST